MEIGDGDWRLEIGDRDWRWRLELVIWDGDLRWIPKSRLFNISKFVPYMLKILYNPEMAKNGCYWPKMMEDDPSGWNKLLPDHPYSIPNDFTIEYKQVYAENLLKLCWKSVKILLKWPKMGIFGHFWIFLGTQSGQNISKEVNLHILVPITSM